MEEIIVSNDLSIVATNKQLPAKNESSKPELTTECIALSKEEQEAIAELIPVRTFAKGTLLLREGEVSNKCYFILNGCVRQYYLMNGEEKTTFFYTEGQSIYSVGGASRRIPAKHYLSCVEETTLTILTDDNQEELFRRCPRFQSLSRLALEEELANYQEMLATYIMHSPKERYLHLLEYRPELLNRVPHYQLASYLGIKPESLSRIRKRIMLKA